MMIDYLSYPKSSLVRVRHPGQQVVGHRYNNVIWGIPRALVPRYYRAANDNGGVEFYLEPDHPAWDELLPYVKAQKLYEPPKPPQVKPVVDENEVYWSMIRKLPGGDDPLWQYAIGPEDEDLHRFVMRDYSRPNKAPWFPRVQLVLRYGTADIHEFAAKHGLKRP